MKELIRNLIEEPALLTSLVSVLIAFASFVIAMISFCKNTLKRGRLKVKPLLDSIQCNDGGSLIFVDIPIVIRNTGANSVVCVGLEVRAFLPDKDFHITTTITANRDKIILGPYDLEHAYHHFGIPKKAFENEIKPRIMLTFKYSKIQGESQKHVSQEIDITNYVVCKQATEQPMPTLPCG